MSMIFLGLYLILVGCAELFHLGVPSILLGILALIAGILVLLGDRIVWPSRPAA